jgi:hypothetical protein
MTTGLTDLTSLERSAFRRFYDDGIFDIYVGTMILVMGVGAVLSDQIGNEVASMLLLLGLAFAVTVPLLLWRRHLLRTRLGDFKPGPQRRRRIRKTRLVLFGSVVLGVIAFAIAAAAFRSDAGEDLIGIVVPLLWFLNATIVFGAMAYLLDVPRFFAHGLIIGVAMPALIWPDVFWDTQVPPLLAFGIPGLIVAAVGIYKLIGFLRDYPLLEMGEELDAGN